MLEVLTGSEIIFQPYSDSDLRLKGDITLKNPHSNRYIAFKIKSTDVTAFEADPSKGTLSPNEIIRIPVVTKRQADAQYAKTLSQKHKFLIEYVVFNTRPSIEETAQKLRSQAAQSIKIYINTNSVRDSKIGKSFKESSVAGTNRYSFHSMAPNTIPQTQSRMTIGSSDQMDRLKSEIDYLQKQRSRLSKDIQGKNKNGKGGILKYLLLLGGGILVGNVTSKYSGLSQYISQNISGSPTPVTVSQDEGFFSIFNFGGESQTHETVIQSSSNDALDSEKSWWSSL